MTEDIKDSAKVKARTVGNVIASLFSNGTNLGHVEVPEQQRSKIKGWPDCPSHPADVFAAASHLLEIAGAYQFIKSVGVKPVASEPQYFHPEWRHPIIEISRTQTDELKDVAGQWAFRKKCSTRLVPPDWSPPKQVIEAWAQIGQYRDLPVFDIDKRYSNSDALAGWTGDPWWWAAVRLLIISDEACEGIGYDNIDGEFETTCHSNKPPPEGTYNQFVWWWQQIQNRQRNEKVNTPQESEKPRKNLPKKVEVITHFDFSSSIAPTADADIVNVQPKMHTASVGSTMRSMSHNLALLPPRGVVRTVWHRPLGVLDAELRFPLNLLLVPFPFNLKAHWFKEEEVEATTTDCKGWAWVSISNEHWIYGGEGLSTRRKEERRRRLWRFLFKLVEEAERDTGPVHGVVFPEDALDWDTYEYLTKRLFAHSRDIQFFISGSSENCQKRQGTCVLTATRGKGENYENKILITSRPKHHRWKLDKSQLITYGLASTLEPSKTYWEKIGLPNREVHIHTFRRASTLTAMLCEDLARTDPCHAVLRAVGPNLILVLLMDGPQIGARWPARYATVFAEDPGSSVLTLTSLGLIRRSNDVKEFTPSRSIGLFRDDKNKQVEILCPEGRHATVVMLHSVPPTEFTLDGRPNDDAISYRYAGQKAIRIEDSDLISEFEAER